MHCFRWLAVLLLLSTAVYAQTFRGTLSENLLDASGAVITNVSLQLTNPAAGAVHDSSTNGEGEFNFPKLTVGKFQLTVTTPGFASKKIDKIEIALSKVTNRRVLLLIGQRSTTVGVQADAIQTDTTSSDLVAVIDSKSVQKIPLNGRNFISAGQNDYNRFNGVIKLDHRFSANEQLSVRYLDTTGTRTADVGSHYADYFQKAPMHIHSSSVVHNSIFTNNVVNQVTLGVGYFLQTFNDAHENYKPAALGLNLGLTGKLATGAPKLTVSGFDYVGAMSLPRQALALANPAMYS